MISVERSRLILIEERLGYTFSDRNLLKRALTRKAYANEQKYLNINLQDQEVFRTLGDAVLKTILIDLLIEKGCKTREDITTRKMKLESEEKLASIARELQIGDDIILGQGERKQAVQDVATVLAETLEALIGAIYLDGGYPCAKEVITNWFKSRIS